MVRRNTDLLNIIDGFTNRKMLVLGEAMLDSYLQGTSERLCQEAPVPVVDIQQTVHVPGGAANTAVNLSSLGAQVLFLSAIGEDGAGSKLRKVLEDKQVSSHLLPVPGRSTLAKQRILSGSQIVVRFDQGSTAPLEGEYETRLIERLKVLFKECDGLVISDYNYGIVTPRVLDVLEYLQRKYPRLIVVNSKRLPAYRRLNVTAIKSNYDETLHLLGLEKMQGEADRVGQITHHGRQSPGNHGRPDRCHYPRPRRRPDLPSLKTILLIGPMPGLSRAPRRPVPGIHLSVRWQPAWHPGAHVEHAAEIAFGCVFHRCFEEWYIQPALPRN